MRIELERVIHRPLTDISAFFSEFGAVLGWQPDLGELVHETPGSVGVGTVYPEPNPGRGECDRSAGVLAWRQGGAMPGAPQ